MPSHSWFLLRQAVPSSVPGQERLSSGWEGLAAQKFWPISSAVCGWPTWKRQSSKSRALRVLKPSAIVAFKDSYRYVEKDRLKLASYTLPSIAQWAWGLGMLGWHHMHCWVDKPFSRYEVLLQWLDGNHENGTSTAAHEVMLCIYSMLLASAGIAGIYRRDGIALAPYPDILTGLWPLQLFCAPLRVIMHSNFIYLNFCTGPQ